MNWIIITVVCCVICIYLTLKFGSHFLSRETKERIFINHLVGQNLDRFWKCLEIIESPGEGPFGSDTRHILLENGKERILLCYFLDEIVVGDYTRLVPRTTEEKPCTWNNTLDRVMKPILVR